MNQVNYSFERELYKEENAKIKIRIDHAKKISVSMNKLSLHENDFDFLKATPKKAVNIFKNSTYFKWNSNETKNANFDFCEYMKSLFSEYEYNNIPLHELDEKLELYAMSLFKRENELKVRLAEKRITPLSEISGMSTLEELTEAEVLVEIMQKILVFKKFCLSLQEKERKCGLRQTIPRTYDKLKQIDLNF